MNPEKDKVQEEDQTVAAEPQQEKVAADDSLVDLYEASNDEVKDALRKAQEEESSATVQSDQSATDDSAVTESTDSGSGELPTKEVAKVEAEPSKPNRTYTEEEIQGLLAERERLKKEGNQKELFIQHRNNELGATRQQLAATRQQLAQIREQLFAGLEDKFAENPIQAINDRERIKELDQQIRGIDQKEARAVNIVEAQTLFVKHVDIDNVSIDDLSSVLKDDGFDDAIVANFKANPWEFTSPEALVQLGKRAQDKKTFQQADQDRRILARHVMALNEEIKKLKARPSQVLTSIRKNLDRMPNINAASSSSNGRRTSIDPASIPHLSNQEVKEALNAAMRQA